jgi:hypothetical protein
LSEKSFREGSLRVTSYVRPGKLFTAHHSLIVGQVGTLSADALAEIIRAVTGLFSTAPAG